MQLRTTVILNNLRKESLRFSCNSQIQHYTNGLLLVATLKTLPLPKTFHTSLYFLIHAIVGTAKV